MNSLVSESHVQNLTNLSKIWQIKKFLRWRINFEWDFSAISYPPQRRHWAGDDSTVIPDGQRRRPEQMIFCHNYGDLKISMTLNSHKLLLPNISGCGRFDRSIWLQFEYLFRITYQLINIIRIFRIPFHQPALIGKYFWNEVTLFPQNCKFIVSSLVRTPPWIQLLMT